MSTPAHPSQSQLGTDQPVPAWSDDYRPASYFGAYDVETRLLTQVKGEWRRKLLLDALEAGEIDEVPPSLLSPGLDDDLRRAVGGLHPGFMGGEYLPTAKGTEVEIARIRVASTMSDVTSVYARRKGKRIAYRVVDEYEGDTLSNQATRTSTQPLTMGELLDFFLRAWDLYEILQLNYENDLESMLCFFGAESAFYPCLDQSLRERVRARFQRLAEVDDDEEDWDEDQEEGA